MQFSDFGLSEPILRALADLGYETPTPIQAGTIELLLADRDVIGQAQTGTGKTAAFMLPILERIDLAVEATCRRSCCARRASSRSRSPSLAELAEAPRRRHVVPVYGGAPIREQVSGWPAAPRSSSARPAACSTSCSRGKLILADARMVVLDEADEMLSMGFIDDVRAILRRTPWGRQTALFSRHDAAAEIRRLAERGAAQPADRAASTPRRSRSRGSRRRRDRSSRARSSEPSSACSRRGSELRHRLRAHEDRRCARLADDLAARGHRVRALHGDMGQGARDARDDRLPRRPRAAARGDRRRRPRARRLARRHVVNYELPDEPEVYIHRIGRTGRVGREGCAITFVSPREQRKLDAVIRLTGVTLVPWQAPGEAAPVDAEAGAATDAPAPPRRPRADRDRGRGGVGQPPPPPRPPRRSRALARGVSDARRVAGRARAAPGSRAGRAGRSRNGAEQREQHLDGVRRREREERAQRLDREDGDERGEQPAEEGRDAGRAAVTSASPRPRAAARGRGRRAQHDEGDGARPRGAPRSGSERVAP